MEDSLNSNAGEPRDRFFAVALGSAEVLWNASEAGDFIELHPATVLSFAREGFTLMWAR